MSVLISAKNLFISWRRNNILEDVSLTIQESDFTTLVGPNGAGKTMLVKCLVGCLRPHRGCVERAKGLVIGYVPQRIIPNFFIPIRVREFLQIHRQSQIAQEAVEEVEIDNLLDKPLASLSGGEFQRVLLARALSHHPQLLVLDEPAQNLDINEQFKFYRLLERIYKQRKIAIVMASHDFHFVMRQTRQVICLHHHICCQGEPQTVTRDPRFISLFGHEAANLMALYQHEHTHHDHS